MGLSRFRTKGRVEKTFISISFVSFVISFFCLDSLFWHGLASLNLVIYQVNTIILRKSFLTCMSLNCSLSFMHWDIIMCLVPNERRAQLFLIMSAYSLIWILRDNHWSYLTDSHNRFPLYWDALYMAKLAITFPGSTEENANFFLHVSDRILYRAHNMVTVYDKLDGINLE